MKIVQLAGGGYDVEAFYIGPERELRVDEDNDSIRLHDGTKVGGYIFLNLDANDARYQARSLELDGFKFGAQQKGILVRTAPSTYRLRKLTANPDEFDVVNPFGTSGDFYFELLDTINTDHTWTGTQTFTSEIQAQAGVRGNVIGNIIGDVVGNVTGNLEGNAHGDHTGSFTGDVDVRGFNFLTDAGQITEEQIDPEAWIRRGVPYGTIVMWAGAADAIPESWALCDGTAGTPNLRDRFVIGAGGAHDVGGIGGSTSASLAGLIAPGGDHTHTVAIDSHVLTIDEMPAHYHASGVCDKDSNECFNHGSQPAVPTSGKQFDTNDGTGNTEGWTTTVGGGLGHTHAGGTASGGAHTHDITLDGISILPPYYALCFIMKIA